MRRMAALLLGLGTMHPLGALGAESKSAPAAATVNAPPPPLAQAQGDLDGDGKPERVRLERDGVVHVEDAGGRELGRVALPVGGAITSGSAAIATVEEHVVAHLRAPLGRGRSAEAVLAVDGGKLQTLFLERTGPVGDGDRAIKVRVGAEGLVRYQTSPTVRRCDGQELLFPERWDFSSGRFRPVDDEVPAGTPLLATTVAPKELAAEPMGLFHFVASSTDAQAASERRADQLAAPHELEDRSDKTVWEAGPPGGGRGAWVTARAQDPTHRVTAVRIVPGPGPAPRLQLMVGTRVFALTLPAGRGPLYAVVPPGEPTACVALIVAEPPRGSSPGTSLAEVAIFTDADVGGGLERLAEQVAAGGPGADGAMQVLAAQRARAVPPIATQLATAVPGPGRHRLVELLVSLDAPDAAPVIARELETAQASDRKLLVDALGRLGARGAEVAIHLYTSASQAPETRVDAARVLGQLASSTGDGSGQACGVLVAGLGRGDEALREATMKAVATAGASNPQVGGVVLVATRAALAPSGESPAPPSPAGPAPSTAPSSPSTPGSPSAALDPRRLGDLAWALGRAAKHDGQRGEAAALLGEVWQQSSTMFEPRLRVLRAIGDLGDPQSAPLLARVIAKDGDEILRWAAVEAAAQLGDAGHATLVAARSDRDPRVRRAALVGQAAHLDTDGGRALVHAVTIEGERWPFVRRAAAEGLGASCAVAAQVGAEAALAGAVNGAPGREDLGGADPSEDVRRAALAGLAHCAPRSPAIARALSSARQPLAVRELAAALVAKGGAPDAAAKLADALDAVLADPSSDERAAGLAVVCVRALGRLKDTSRPILESLGAASNESLSPAVRAAAMDTIGRLCPDGARSALDRGAKDPDGSVRKSAATALERCKK